MVGLCGTLIGMQDIRTEEVGSWIGFFFVISNALP